MAPIEIDLRLRTLDELFNSLGPSPLVPILNLPAAALDGIDARAVEESVTNYFSFLSGRQSHQLHVLTRESRRGALVGPVFLIACIAGSQAFRAFVPGMGGNLVSEGLIIIGWVANWRPARQKARIYARLVALSLQMRQGVRAAPSPIPV